jgi:hypothetical protein
MRKLALRALGVYKLIADFCGATKQSLRLN